MVLMIVIAIARVIMIYIMRINSGGDSDNREKRN